MTKSYCVYWIHKDDDTDYNTTGYVGISTNVKQRVKDHLKMSGSCRHLYHALTKYKDQVSFSVLANNLDEEAACLL